MDIYKAFSGSDFVRWNSVGATIGDKETEIAEAEPFSKTGPVSNARVINLTVLQFTFQVRSCNGRYGWDLETGSKHFL
jgi:hypothetical protein